MHRLLNLGLGVTLLVVLQVACGAQSSLDPAGEDARVIARLWWILLALGSLIFLGIMAVLAMALFRRRELDENTRDSEPIRAVLLIGGGLPMVILPVLLGLMFYTMMAGSHRDEPELTIEVIGHQFWWEIRYPAYGITTANEIHVPVNRTVRLELTSADVIHSFSVPGVHGKMDLIPGQTNTLNIRVLHQGVFRGQCMEFCGVQHANMGILLIADPDFQQWTTAQSRPAAVPLDPIAMRGQEIFFARNCAVCHGIRGTNAAGTLGPDLTHLAGRRTLAAATLENHPSNLREWVADPQADKPGSLMPPTTLSEADLAALLAYLQTLE